LNPRTRVPVASMLTAGPPKGGDIIGHCETKRSLYVCNNDSLELFESTNRLKIYCEWQ
jgi:hypothetical protein